MRVSNWRDRQSRSITFSMSDTSSDDVLDGLVEDESSEEVDVDEDILEALEGDLAEQASDADDVTSHCFVDTPCPADLKQLCRIPTTTLTIQTTNPSLTPLRARPFRNLRWTLVFRS